MLLFVTLGGGSWEPLVVIFNPPINTRARDVKLGIIMLRTQVLFLGFW
jgi:hypothetical protein